MDYEKAEEIIDGADNEKSKSGARFMKTVQIDKLTITWLGRVNARFAEYQPGNGTHYRAIAIPWHGSVYCGALGRISEGWLVINCNTRLAYLFGKDGLLVDRYIQEKLGGMDGDYPYFGDLVRILTDRQYPRKEGTVENSVTRKNREV